MENLIEKKTLIIIILIFVTIIFVGLSWKSVYVKDGTPKCGPRKDENGEIEQICVDQHHYISLFEKYFSHKK